MCRFGQNNFCQRLRKAAQSAINRPIWAHLAERLLRAFISSVTQSFWNLYFEFEFFFERHFDKMDSNSLNKHPVRKVKCPLMLTRTSLSLKKQLWRSNFEEATLKQVLTSLSPKSFSRRQREKLFLNFKNEIKSAKKYWKTNIVEKWKITYFWKTDTLSRNRIVPSIE